MGVLTEERVVVGRCHAPNCTAARYGTKAEPPVGFYSTVEEVVDDSDGVRSIAVQVFGCTRAHLKKAIEAALDDPAGAEQITYSEQPDGYKRILDRTQPEHENAGEQANNAR